MTGPEFQALMNRVNRSGSTDPARTLRAAGNLVRGAQRIRRGGDGLYGVVETPVSVPAEAVGAWVRSLEGEVLGGQFERPAEALEALRAAAEEVDAAATAHPSAAGLRSALYADALGLVGESSPRLWHPAVPWVVATGLAGVVVGLLLSMHVHRRRR